MFGKGFALSIITAVAVIASSGYADQSVSPNGGDTCIVIGTVKDSLGAPVAGAVVSAMSIGGIGGSGGGTGIGGTARDTTDATGAYEITMVNALRSSTITVYVTTSGINYGVAQGSIANPSDGQTDRITVDITLGKIAISVRQGIVKRFAAPANLPVSSYTLNGRLLKTQVMAGKEAASRMTVKRTAVSTKTGISFSGQ
jgi:hypothetical protein